ncbi:MAG TPA: hypothetical protein VHL09_17450, partial [Dehalococcoidia bacterium]|nr:hypothetical protein [Dehalococcoidia bacterium]
HKQRGPFMRMMTKSILLSLGVILVMTISVLGVGTVIIDDILYRSQDRVLRLELANASQMIFQKLDRSGMRAAVQAAAELQEHLRETVGLKSVRLFVVEAPDNRIVYHPDRTRSPPPLIRRRSGWPGVAALYGPGPAGR